MKIQIRKKIMGVLSEPLFFLKRIRTIASLENEFKKNRVIHPLLKTQSNSLLYVAASSLPYHTSGYTIRTQEVLCALKTLSQNVHAITRPGYPWDRKDCLHPPKIFHTSIEDIVYEHTNFPSNSPDILKYALLAADSIIKKAQNHQITFIHAASNHINALPALIAAKKLGIPFQYEMRGLWELTRISRMPKFEKSQAYRQGLELEGLVAKHADRIFVISEQLSQYIQSEWGIPQEKISFLPNCTNPERISLADQSQVEPMTVGYAGSIINYEGLDILIEATDILKKQGVNVKINIIGNGEALPQLKNLADELNLNDRITFWGQLPQKEALNILAKCSVICIPRKPFRVCKIIPPIKLVESMALGKPVVLPDLPVFKDEVKDVSSQLFFRPGDANDLASVLNNILVDPEKMALIGSRNRAFIEKNRNWTLFIKNILPQSSQIN